MVVFSKTSTAAHESTVAHDSDCTIYIMIAVVTSDHLLLGLFSHHSPGSDTLSYKLSNGVHCQQDGLHNATDMTLTLDIKKVLC